MPRRRPIEDDENYDYFAGYVSNRGKRKKKKRVVGVERKGSKGDQTAELYFYEAGVLSDLPEGKVSAALAHEELGTERLQAMQGNLRESKKARKKFLEQLKK